MEWHNREKTIQLVTLMDCHWNWHHFADAIQQQVTMAQTVEHPLHVIFDFSVCPRFPQRGLMTRLPELMTTGAGNEELIILVRANRIFITMIQTVGKIFNLKKTLSRFHFVDSMEQAYMEIKAFESGHPL